MRQQVRRVRLGEKSSKEWFDPKAKTRSEVMRRCKFLARKTNSIIEILDHEDAIIYKVFGPRVG